MGHLISPLDFTVEETYEVLDFADRIAANPKAYAHAADGRQLATLFYEPSTRTRLSFESAMLSLGGQTMLTMWMMTAERLIFSRYRTENICEWH